MQWNPRYLDKQDTLAVPGTSFTIVVLEIKTLHYTGVSTLEKFHCVYEISLGPTRIALIFIPVFRFFTHSFSSYGTVLYINTVEHTADGRSLITTTGEKRFQVVERSGCDGYNTAKIRFIVDEPVTDLEEIGQHYRTYNVCIYTCMACCTLYHVWSYETSCRVCRIIP